MNANRSEMLIAASSSIVVGYISAVYLYIYAEGSKPRTESTSAMTRNIAGMFLYDFGSVIRVSTPPVNNNNWKIGQEV